MLRSTGLLMKQFKSRHSVAQMCTTTTGKAASNVISKDELISKLVDATSLKKKDIGMVLQSFMDIIHEDVFIQGKELRIVKFGTFKQKTIASATRRNVSTGELFQSTGATSLAFKPSRTTFRTPN